MTARLTPDEMDLLAAEYALGVLDSAERARAEDLARQDPAFAASVAQWDGQLAPLAEDIAPVPAPDLMPQINARLFGAPPKGWRRFLPQGGLGGMLGAALGTALGTGALAALSVVAIAVLLQFSNGIDRPLPVATLVAEGSAVQFAARLDGNLVTVTQTAGTPAATGRSYELWLIDGDAAPLSLGLITASITLDLPAAGAGFVLAVTDEPFGGGPGGVPTGPVIAAGSFPDI